MKPSGLLLPGSRMELERALQVAREALRGISETAPLDAQVLLAHIVQQPRAWVLAHPEAELGENQLDQLEDATEKLKNGIPLPYVLGQWEFYGLTFFVTQDTLIPRPETELLVETALAWLARHPGKRRAADVGTGTGCITVVIAKNIADISISAIDISDPALAVAKRNADRHGVAAQVDFIKSDLFSAEAVRGAVFDLIVSNPPYIPTGMLQGLDVYGREPTLALDGGADGLATVRRLLGEARSRLVPGGLVLVEIEAAQGEAAKRLGEAQFPRAEVKILQDLAGHDRLLVIEST